MALVHYKGNLGEFDYDDTQFEIDTIENYLEVGLRYIGTETDGSKIHIPESVTHCNGMFMDCESLRTPPVIPEGVINCDEMFWGCKNLEEPPVIPDGVKDCQGMFGECENLKEASIIPEGVKNCAMMFFGCKNLKTAPMIPEGVEDVYGMFAGCSEKVQSQANIFFCEKALAEGKRKG